MTTKTNDKTEIETSESIPTGRRPVEENGGLTGRAGRGRFESAVERGEKAECGVVEDGIRTPGNLAAHLTNGIDGVVN